MRRLLLGAVFVLAIPGLGTAAPLCAAGTLANYIALGAGGCSIGSVSFFDFSAGTVLASATPIAAADIAVSPLAIGVGLDFGFNVNALAADLFDVLIGYSVDGGLFGTNTLSMTGSSVTGDAAITAIEDKCIGGTYAGSDPSTACSGTALFPALLVIDVDVFEQLSDTAAFAPSSFFDVFTEITIDGGLSGSATLNGTVTNQFGEANVAAVPEPSAILLVGSGLFGLWARRRRRVPNQ
jgi:hypothetical protein